MEPPPPPAPAPCLRIERIEVHKARRRLVAHCGGEVRVELPVALGRIPRGAKQRAEDRRTPEGRYRVVERPRPSRFHIFIPIDYPSIHDAQRGLDAGEISPEIYERVRRAEQQGKLPPQDTILGGAIGLHGEGVKWRGESGRSDWTLGCIALTDRDIEFIAERVEIGTEVRIEP